ncbi:unnamed protein product [Prunus armeniaca]
MQEGQSGPRWQVGPIARGYGAIMSFDMRSRSSSSQVALYLWGGSQVHKKRFVANLHRIKSKADVHVRLAEPSTACSTFPWVSDYHLKEFFYFFEVRRCEKYTQLRAHKEKLFNNLGLDDDALSTNVWEVNKRWEGDVDDGS